mmetsp:Transcript_41382/g.74600  ORF Transcript_41382/g.74600 Transcript_41382/m.74600 type:complete len:150 (+) Transcript_41382:33-482(+)
MAESHYFVADKLVAPQDENMRRSNKAVKTRTTHLDLSSNDDVGSAKPHKRKGTTKSAIAVALLCGLVALGTLFYVSDKVLTPGKKMVMGTEKEVVSGSKSLPHGERFMAQQLLPPDSIYRTKVQDIHGDWQQLMQYSGSVSLVVNVACE